MSNDAFFSILTNEPSGTLSCNFDTEGSRSMRFVWVAFYRNVPVRFKGPVDPTIVLISVLRVMVLWPNACGLSLVLCWTTLEALDAFAQGKQEAEGTNDVVNVHPQVFECPTVAGSKQTLAPCTHLESKALLLVYLGSSCKHQVIIVTSQRSNKQPKTFTMKASILIVISLFKLSGKIWRNSTFFVLIFLRRFHQVFWMSIGYSAKLRWSIFPGKHSCHTVQPNQYQPLIYVLQSQPIWYLSCVIIVSFLCIFFQFQWEARISLLEAVHHLTVKHSIRVCKDRW